MLRTVMCMLALVACGARDDTGPANVGHAEPAAKADAILVLGDATVYELVDRRYRKLDPPKRDLVLHADGTAELINGKTDKVMLTFKVSADGTVVSDLATATISRHAITTGKRTISIEGDTVSLTIDDKPIAVSLAKDGSVTVADSPYGTKWRIEAKDPTVARTAFLVLAAVSMRTALD